MVPAPEPASEILIPQVYYLVSNPAKTQAGPPVRSPAATQARNEAYCLQHLRAWSVARFQVCSSALLQVVIQVPNHPYHLPDQLLLAYCQMKNLLSLKPQAWYQVNVLRTLFRQAYSRVLILPTLSNPQFLQAYHHRFFWYSVLCLAKPLPFRCSPVSYPVFNQVIIRVKFRV